ncbi:glycosyltransferase [Stutzerimonas chloritidismutans]|uniref:glycosyltransferase n=1 Tax=Stutzerimonas chloritidismutans TaxID=203192 RepID=UPI002898DE6D|nr:glycosyltransferase [Stutzerimonas chloritidismutans]
MKPGAFQLATQDINKQFNQLRNSFRKELRESVNDIRLDALYQQLLMQHVFQRPEPLAAMTSWSVAPEFAWWLFQHVTTTRPGKIIELGSGTSTLVIAAALKQLGVGRFLSFEHDHAYLEKTRDLLQVCGLQEHVELIFAPLEEVQLEGETYRWYDLPYDLIDHMVGREELDLLLVDGPPAATNHHARYPALARLHGYCNESTLVLLDDAGRKEEQEILGRWGEILEGKCSHQMLSNVRHGPALFHFTKKPILLNGCEQVSSSSADEGDHQDVERSVKGALLRVQQDQNEELVQSLLNTYYRLRERSLDELKLKNAEVSAQIRAFEGETSALKQEFASERLRLSERNQFLESRNDELVRELKEVQGQLEAATRNQDAVKAELRELTKKYELVFKSVVYQLGMATYRQTRSVTGWLKMPLAIKRVMRRHAASGNPDVIEYQARTSQHSKGGGKSMVPESSQQAKSFGFVARSGLLVKATQGKSESVLWMASQLVDEHGYEAGLRFAEKNLDDFQRPALNILRANASLNSEMDWLKYINAYLKSFAIAPVDLASYAGSRFLRLRVATQLAPVEGCLVTVIMPAFNAEASIKHAAESVLAQTWHNIELIIVDDCSSDSTLSVAQAIAKNDSRVKVLHNPVNVGPYVSKNLALRIARGEYITGHDADDWAHPERIARHMQEIFSEPKPPKASLSGMIRVNESGAVTRFSKLSPNTRDGVLSSAFISCMFEARFLKEVLGSWEEVKFAGDSELIRRAEKVIGGPMPRYNFLGMICLDQEGSLTNDPEHGHSPITGVSKSRQAFRKEFSAWHAKASIEELFLPFPQASRALDIPESVRVPCESVKQAVEYHEESYGKRRLVCDVCIVTDLRFPGGNASSTLDEVKFFTSKGMSVRLIHCPSLVSRGKGISDRYDQWAGLIDNFYAVTSVDARYLIIRHPTVACSAGFEMLSRKIKAGAVIAVINNSVSRIGGKAVYSLQCLAERLESLNADVVKVFPLSPAIRKELQGHLSAQLLSDVDWNPTFDASQFAFSPKQANSEPYVIGRHGRDGREKWIESKKALCLAYPEDDLFKISILGGADNAYKVIGRKPSNWEVFSFGEVPPEKYLAGIDFFVYFPHTELNEAFGRTIIEAAFVGVPCILPVRFKETFGDLAFYCDPVNVRSLISRLANSPTYRLMWVSAVRDIAVKKYETNVLAKRLEEVGQHLNDMLGLDVNLLHYKKWIETGEGQCFE